MVAEVVIKDGHIRVTRAVLAVDCGLPINPDGIRTQGEDALIYGLTAAMKSPITVDKGGVVQSKFHDYEVLRMNEAPLTEVHIVESKEKPTGMREPIVPVVAPSVCNASSPPPESVCGDCLSPPRASPHGADPRPPSTQTVFRFEGPRCVAE